MREEAKQELLAEHDEKLKDIIKDKLKEKAKHLRQIDEQKEHIKRIDEQIEKIEKEKHHYDVCYGSDTYVPPRKYLEKT